MCVSGSYLLRSSLKPSSISTYRRAWKLFYKFDNSVFQLPFAFLPIFPSLLALFIAYLVDFHYAPSTVTKYISALGYSHKLLGFPDPFKVFYVSQILKGYEKVGFRLDSRLPITLPILDRLVSIAPSLQGSTYQMSQFRAMCSLAFYAFLRIGEMTATINGNTHPPLQLYQLTKLISPSGELMAFKLTFGDYKHSYNARPISVVLSRQPNSTCPVALLSKYFTRGHFPFRRWVACFKGIFLQSASKGLPLVWLRSFPFSLLAEALFLLFVDGRKEISAMGRKCL